MGKHTALHTKQVESKAKFVDQGDWTLPAHYGSPTQEHHAVRQQAGMFDASHMSMVDIQGLDAEAYLQKLLSRDVTPLKSGNALYSCMLNHNGGIIDDLILYKLDDGYRMVSNDTTRLQALEWMMAQTTGFEVTLTDRPELALIAIQGPQALNKVKTVCPEAADLIDNLAPFQCQTQAGWLYARTGYTGELGLEVILPETEAADFWQTLLDAGVTAYGLDAAESLRIEAGFNAYHKEMDENHSPLVSNLAQTVNWSPDDRAFIGRDALAKEQAEGAAYRLVGLLLDSDQPADSGQKVITEQKESGQVTSAVFSPTLNQAIAIARVDKNTKDTCQVEIQGNLINAKVIALPFVRYAKPQF